MLEFVAPGSARIGDNDYVPPFLVPLIAASKRGEPLITHVQSVTNHLGFDSFLYATSTMPQPDHEGRALVFTTQPRDWVLRYDQRAYVEVDPRVRINWDNAIPLIWDQRTVRGRSAPEDAFLDDALSYGIASGISYMFHGPHGSHVLVALNSAVEINDPIRLQAMTRNMPDILLFGHYFHEVFMRAVVAGVIKFPSVPLSPRERQCLRLCANGLTTDDIANKLSIRSRTVQFHFDSARSKLGAANRQEAIAIAARRNELWA